MKSFGGWQFPDGEVHLIDWMIKVNDVKDGRHRYQGKKYDMALTFCDQRRTCVDIGAHIGLFSYWLSQDFEKVEAFEPVAAHRDCFGMNVTAENVTLHACALGDREDTVRMFTAATSSGDSWVENGTKPDNVKTKVSDAGDIPLCTLDSFALQDVDFVKIDTEGFEFFALRGGEETIKRCRPVILVEQKPGRAVKYGLEETQAVALLQSWGAKLRKVMSGDYILSFDRESVRV